MFLWFIIFDVVGGVIEDVLQNVMVFVYCDKVMYYQFYGIGLFVIKIIKDFIIGFYDQVVQKVGLGIWGMYLGYVNNVLVNQ